MKKERGSMPSNGNSSSKSQGTGKTKSGDRKGKAVNIDNTGATEKVRSRHGHGLSNEGTNVSYEEER